MASYKDFIDMDLNDVMRMNASELRSALQVLNKRANARLTALEVTPRGTESPVYKARDGRRFTSAGKNLNQMRESFREVKQFLSRPSSTVGGFHKLEYKTAERLGISKEAYTGDNDRRSGFWARYREFERTHPAAIMSRGSAEAQRTIAQMIENDIDPWDITDEDIIDEMSAPEDYYGDDLDDFYDI